MTCRSLFLSVALTIFSVAFTQDAFAQDTADPADTPKDTPVEWVSQQYKVMFTGNGIKKDHRYKPYPAEILYTTAFDAPGNVAIHCVNGVMTASVGMEPVDFSEILSDWLSSQRSKSRMPTMKINGERIDAGTWRYVQRFKLLHPGRPHISKKLYNAAIRGETVTLSLDFGNEVTLVLPKPNRDFAHFGAGCGIGKSAK